MSVKEKHAKKYAKIFRRTMKEIGRTDADKLYEVFTPGICPYCYDEILKL